MEAYLKLWEGWFWFWGLGSMINNKGAKRKIDRRTAKFKVTKTKVIKATFYSDAVDADRAKEEAWTAFNIFSDRVKSGPQRVDMVVELNPDRTVDDDGYDTVTGLPYR